MMNLCFVFVLSYFFFFFFFFFNDTATTEIYTLSLHDALPISTAPMSPVSASATAGMYKRWDWWSVSRSEEHTSELQSRLHLVCRLLLEKKKLATGDLHVFTTKVVLFATAASGNFSLSLHDALPISKRGDWLSVS